MQSASAQLAQPLPRLVQQATSSNASVRNVRLARSCMHLWPNFLENVKATIQGLNLNGMISVHDRIEGELYYVGNELGLTGRFVENLGVPVTKAYRYGNDDPALNGLRFGDYHAAAHMGTPLFPAVAILKDDHHGCVLRCVGEIKTFWTLPLELIPVTAPDLIKVQLENPIGQVVSYMRAAELRYGFLSTYRATVFIHRTDNYRFELSPPVSWNTTQPSLRECFFALGLYITEGFSFIEQEVLNARIVCEPHSCNRDSPSGNFREAGFSLLSYPTPTPVTPNTIFFGTGGTATNAVECTSIIHGALPQKVVLKAVFGGTDVIVKYWPVTDYDSYDTELEVYQRLNGIAPHGGHSYFASLIAHGEVICSSILPNGYLIVMTELPGEPFSNRIWRMIGPHGRNEMSSKLQEAISVLRHMNLWNRDAAKDNILYDMATGSVAMIDFEQMESNDLNNFELEGPELWIIMAEPNDIW
ncbi:hypothetical protein DFH27DRAFT_620698 [Peziza echinospora]|nr:hypothetical protein DFH27DRAFT_620698 [Peziza echinospora]